MSIVIPLSRRERERNARRQEMLGAARSLFAEKGYAGATLEEIAQRAEFGKGTLYNYFDGGKEELLRAILDQMFDEVVELTSESFIPAVLETTPMRAVFRNYLKRIFDYYRDNADLFLIMVKEAQRIMLANDERMSAYLGEQHIRIIDSLRPMLEHGMRTGQIRTLPVDAVSELILGNVRGCQFYACTRSAPFCGDDTVPPTPDEQADLLTTILFDGLNLRADQQPEPKAATTNESSEFEAPDRRLT